MIVNATPPNAYACCGNHPHQIHRDQDSLSSNAPHIETLHAHGLHYIPALKTAIMPYLHRAGADGRLQGGKQQRDRRREIADRDMRRDVERELKQRLAIGPRPPGRCGRGEQSKRRE